MKIISWNTYLAPTMPNRFVRKKYVVNKIEEWINQNTDIIALQEVNDINIGILGYIYITFELFKYCNIFFQRFFDLIMVIEGKILPFFYYDNSKEIFDLAKSYNYSFVKSRETNLGLNGGLVIISKYKYKNNMTYYLPTDLCHIPNLLLVEYNNFILINNHLLPNLPNYTLLYRLVNLFNYLCCINIRKKQIENINTLNTFTSVKHKNKYVVGDFNIKKKGDNELYNYLIKQTKLIDSVDYICTEHHLDYNDGELGHEEDQIDYILSNKRPIKKCIRIEDTKHISDHYPILSIYEKIDF